MSRRTAAAVTILIAGLTASGCSDDGNGPAGDGGPARQVAWQEVELPAPPGPAGRVAVRDATHCEDRWYVVGAVVGSDGSSRPAAWTSGDALAWHAIRTAPRQFWARQAVLSSVACRHGRIAVVGAKPGGAHGNPRTITWRQRTDGTLVDVLAPIELYGGPSAVSVNRIAAGPDGWLVAGTRRTGAAVWLSPDATGFRLVDDDPGLSSDGERTTAALDAVHDGAAWTVTGRSHVAGQVPPGPTSWTSVDGSTWQREHVPAGTLGYADLQRVARLGGSLIAVGIRGDAFGLWQRRAGRWHAGAGFGEIADDAARAPFVSGLAVAHGSVLVTFSDAARFRLWAGEGGRTWRELRTPSRPTVTGDAQMTVAASGTTVLLLADDGTSGRAWVASWTTGAR